MTKLISILFIVFCLIGCGTGDHRISADLNSTFVISSELSLQDQDDIVYALNEWNVATDGMVSGKSIIADHVELYNDNPIIELHYGLNQDEVLAVTHTTPSQTTINMFVDMIHDNHELTKEVAAHELGHAFGLIHLTEGLMRPTMHKSICIDSFTLNSFCEFHDCSHSNVHTTCVE